MKILGGFDQLKKNLDLQYDFYKHLTTISSAAILFIVAFVNRRLYWPQRVFIIAAIIGFLLSIVSALLVMMNVGVQSQDIGNLSVRLGLGESEKDTEGIRKKVEAQWDGISQSTKWVTYCFGAGILSCIVFFFLAVFRTGKLD